MKKANEGLDQYKYIKPKKEYKQGPTKIRINQDI